METEVAQSNHNQQEVEEEEEEIIELDQDLLLFIGNILNEAQKSVATHLKNLREIFNKFKTTPRSLVPHLAPFLDPILLRFKKDATVERMIDFFIKIATYNNGEDNENGQEWIDIITTQLIEYCLTKENAKNKAIRYRVCDIIGRLLKNMAETYELDEDLWERLEEILVRRLKDKIPQVRQRAAFAVHRLSDPSSEECKVRIGLALMMDFDSNKDCRREALKSIDLHRKTVKIILRRCRDTSEEVRKAAFERLHQVDIRALSIRQRVDLLKSGLTERSDIVKKSCITLLCDRWLKNRDNDIIQLLKLLDIEQYENEAEIVLNTIFDGDIALTVDPPPYNLSDHSNEHFFYWRCQIEWFSKQKPIPMQQEIDDAMPDPVNFIKLFDDNVNSDDNNNYILQQLLILARYLNLEDEYSRSALSRIGIKLLESYNVENTSIPLIMKLLRKLHSNDEEDYTRLIRETVEEIRNPINDLSMNEKEAKEDEYTLILKKLEKEKLELETLQKSSHLRHRFDDIQTQNDNNNNDDNIKLKLDKVNKEIIFVNEKLNDIDRSTELTWIRMLCIITDLIQFTNCHWEHDYIKPMFDDIIVPTVIEKRPLVRAQGLKAFALFLQMDKTNTQNNLILFLHILMGDGPASEYFALQALFDFLMIFDLFPPQNEHDINNDNNNKEDDDNEQELQMDNNGNLPIKPPKTDKELIKILKDFLEHEDEELLVCAVEGFTKLLFMNRLKHYKLDVLTHLILLYFNPVTEENNYVRQILSVFFPYFVDPKTFPNNRQHIANCLMPCIRTCAYAPKESPLSQISTIKLTEYLLWLLCADGITDGHNAAKRQINKTDTITLHERLAFDILFEIDAHPESEQVRVLSRILTILQLNDENQHNLKQYKVLINRLLNNNNIKNKPSIKYLEKFLNQLNKIDTHSSQQLDEQQLEELEKKRKDRVEEIQKEHLLYLSDSEKQEIEQEFGIQLLSNDVNDNNNDNVSMITDDTEYRRKKQLRTKQSQYEDDNNHNNHNQDNIINDDQSEDGMNTQRPTKRISRQKKGNSKQKKKATRRIVKNKSNNTQSSDSQNDLENEEEKKEILSEEEEEQQNDREREEEEKKRNLHQPES